MKNFWEKVKQIFKKFQSYSTWVSLSAAIVLLVTALGKVFGFSVENEVVENVVMSVAGVLVVLGIVVSPTETEASTDADETTENEEKNETSDENCEENENDDENE